MRKSAILLILMMFFAAACGDGEDALGFDPNVSAGTMEELTVTSYGAVNPEHSRAIVTIDSGLGIELTIQEYEGFETLADSCTSIAQITESDLEAVAAAVAAANIANYVPPSEEEGCEILVGSQGYGINYRTVEGDVFSFDTGFCSLDEEIENLISVVTELAGQHFTNLMDCTGDNDTKNNEGDDNAGEESDVVVYDVPIINPRTMPRPTRVKY